ncbi:MAG: alpha/beta hydrolase [Sulfitobacter sp.]
MTLKTRRLSKTGPRFAYREQGTGPAVVLIHGVGLQSAAWQPQMAELAKGYRAIALDMPGHGGSDPLPTGAQLGKFVTWCEQAIRALELGPVSVAGHSMGALIAAGLAVTNPTIVERVALLNGVFRRDPQAHLAVVERAAQIRGGAVDLEGPIERWFTDAPSDRYARDLTAGWLRDVDLEGYATAYSAFASGDATYADGFAKIACPLLALTGSDDPNSTPEMARKMAATAQNGRAVVIEGQRHMVGLTAPDQVNAHLFEWLKTPALTTASL